MTSLAEQVRATRSRLDREAGEAQATARAGRAAVQRAARLKDQVELHERVAAVLTSLGEERQERAQRQLEGLVTEGLRAVFGEGLSFHVVQSVQRGQACVDFMIRSDYDGQQVETPVLGSRGGGMAATVGFMLRLVVLLLTPGARRVMFLDETFAHVSEEYEPALAEFLREVADKAGVQLVLVTHSKAYSDVADLGAEYQFSLGPDGCTKVSSLASPPSE